MGFLLLLAADKIIVIGHTASMLTLKHEVFSEIGIGYVKSV